MGKKIVLVGVPQTYPVQPINGCVLADFLAPGPQSEYAYPPSLKEEIRLKVGDYLLDVPAFRLEDKERLREDLFALMENRFAVAQYLMEHKPWDLFMMVDMTLDRLHHAFWKYADPEHPKYLPESPYGEMFRRIYEEIDARVGRLIEYAGEDTAVLVVSDHGARAMMGGLCINEWLAQNGWLTLHERPRGVTRFEDCRIDWARTRAWALGGYYGRIFINVAGREPQGIVPPEEYEATRDELAESISRMPGPDGLPLGNVVYRPEDVYARVEGIAPDLLAYFGGLSWRAVGSMGYDEVYTAGNDIGPDDANHDLYGIFIMNEWAGVRGELSGPHIMDVAPTVLDLFGVRAPDGMQGKIAGADRQFGK
jgi:predicted AlkP superfamily phosphohydrolase/phosphomutase